MARLRLALLGDPVAHSLSPVLHDQAFRDTGREGRYEVIRADRSRLELEIESLRRGERDGINVTMPLKEEAAKLCDRLTPEAEKCESVNAIRFDNGAVVGHSTDLIAMEAVLDAWRPTSVHILGGGGSARAALAAVETVAYLSSRRIEAARELAGSRELASVVSWGAAVAAAVVINATPLGMAGEPLPSGVLAVADGLVDLPYGPTPTPAVVEAEARGISVVDGIGFLAVQAAASFTWWTGEPVDSASMATAARNV